MLRFLPKQWLHRASSASAILLWSAPTNAPSCCSPLCLCQKHRASSVSAVLLLAVAQTHRASSMPQTHRASSASDVPLFAIATIGANVISKILRPTFSCAAAGKCSSASPVSGLVYAPNAPGIISSIGCPALCRMSHTHQPHSCYALLKARRAPSMSFSPTLAHSRMAACIISIRS